MRDALGVAPVSVSKDPLPSRSHSYPSIVPSGSLDATASKSTCWPVKTLDADAVAAGPEELRAVLDAELDRGW